ncbi:MAG: alanine--tRNA ligase [Thermodesulfobacteriota bacterium]|nr:alanine--tRNA ligase [Thermodesulfobacteriota bacterium]
MTGSEIRQCFLKYFEKRGHSIVKSSSLIPKNDPTLLFNNAGMVQFKRVFLGEEKLGYNRAVTSQKCVRAGGKHNDLENVGMTARHHTFFEMLGNFSFGDYFKEDAISMSWEFLTEELGLCKDRLWITVYEDDDDAHDLWQDRIGIPEEKIVRMGEEDNFWSMGDTGPCGPCSEILIDQGADLGCKKPTCKVGCDCDRFLELWNLVFMQFDRNAKGALTPLPQPSIDTGMGLERITAVVQGVKSNYETDLFMTLINFVAEISNGKYRNNEKKDISLKVIADHSRAIAFLIGDGVLPSNEGRGYVLRRIMRRAARYGKILGIDRPFLYRVSDVVIDVMKEAYPEIADARNYIAKLIYNEEERFCHTLDKGLSILNEEIERLKGSGKIQIPGDLLFKLYDTYGFPADLVYDVAREQGATVDEKGFEEAMEEQRQRARESWKGSGEDDVLEIYRTLAKDKIKSSFSGYERDGFDILENVLTIIKAGREVECAFEGDCVEVVTGRTPFYGESGGQVGDTGTIEGGSLFLEIKDTLRPLPDLILHRGKIKKGSLKKGDRVTFHLNTDRRLKIAINHTTTHLLHSALREVLGDHVKQSGSLVAPERLRFDFTHFSQITDRELIRIEGLVNQRIRDNIDVNIETMDMKKAMESGAIALFGEKYSDEVRVVEVPGYSKELCGGTHVKRTGDIGLFKVINESGIAAGVRRIEALTGEDALEYINRQEDQLKEIGALLKTGKYELVDKVEKLILNKKNLEKEVDTLKSRLASRLSGDILDGVKDVSGIKVLAAKVNIDNPKGLRDFADKLKDRLGSGIILLAGQKDGNVLLVLVVTKDLIHRFNAGKIIKDVVKSVGGSGGGRADMAQAGGNNIEGIDKAIESVYDIVKRTVATRVLKEA